MGNWKKKILLLDHNAEFDETQICIVRHSICGQNVKVKEPYNITCFSYHIDKECVNLKPKPSVGTPTHVRVGPAKANNADSLGLVSGRGVKGMQWGMPSPSVRVRVWGQ